MFSVKNKREKLCVPSGQGSLSFGLINIPVRLFSATQDHGLSFDMLHKKDLSPIRYARICKAERERDPL